MREWLEYKSLTSSTLPASSCRCTFKMMYLFNKTYLLSSRCSVGDSRRRRKKFNWLTVLLIIIKWNDWSLGRDSCIACSRLVSLFLFHSQSLLMVYSLMIKRLRSIIVLFSGLVLFIRWFSNPLFRVILASSSLTPDTSSFSSLLMTSYTSLSSSWQTDVVKPSFSSFASSALLQENQILNNTSRDTTGNLSCSSSGQRQGWASCKKEICNIKKKAIMTEDDDYTFLMINHILPDNLFPG